MPRGRKETLMPNSQVESSGAAVSFLCDKFSQLLNSELASIVQTAGSPTEAEKIMESLDYPFDTIKVGRELAVLKRDRPNLYAAINLGLLFLPGNNIDARLFPSAWKAGGDKPGGSLDSSGTICLRRHVNIP